MLAISSLHEVMKNQSFLVETDIGTTQRRSLIKLRKSECTRQQSGGNPGIVRYEIEVGHWWAMVMTQNIAIRVKI